MTERISGGQGSIIDSAIAMKDALVDYIEASGHIKHEDIVRERNALLNADQVVAQEPFLETTPTYKSGDSFEALGLPGDIGSALRILTTSNADGQPIEPFKHQAEALTGFLKEDSDLVVSTGTGSGKTECFLWPIVGSLLREATEHRDTYARHGVRVLILYPTNALVGDQISRLRRLFGSPNMKELFASRGARVPTFGTYTSRTPYANVRTPKRDNVRLKPVVDYYLKTQQSNPELADRLRRLGRWPSKNLEAFAVGYESAPDDAELFTRHEMQQNAPDILVTNYSMLEYMLMRPIEREIFTQTRARLEADRSSEFLVVLDEAHLYRGSGGTEVSLLARRLHARVGANAGQQRFILTSASLGDMGAARDFASRLTGKDSSGFQVISGEVQLEGNEAPATLEQGQKLAGMLDTLRAQTWENTGEAINSCIESVFGLDERQHVEQSDSQELSSDGAFELLSSFPPMQLLLKMTTGDAIPFSSLADTIFDHNSDADAKAALSSLLLLGVGVHKNGRPLLPTRMHMLFRGIRGLYACVNRNCTERRSGNTREGTLGALYTEPRLQCGCGGRVYEMVSHSDCGAVFLRCFHRDENAPTFFWHERGEDDTLVESYLLVGERIETIGTKTAQPLAVHVYTGQVDLSGRLERDVINLHRIVPPSSKGKGKSRETFASNRFGANFSQCPVCSKKNQSSRIQTMATTGETPFGVLVRQQFMGQMPPELVSPDKPNGGKKAIIFSDGRQRAARLARDLPREVEFDAFRAALALAWEQLGEINEHRTLDLEVMYKAFVSVCSRLNLSFFDGESGGDAVLREHVERFHADDGEDLETAIWNDGYEVPMAFRLAVFRQLADPRSPLVSAALVLVTLSKGAANQLKRLMGMAREQPFTAQVESSIAQFIQRYLESGSFDQDLDEWKRRQVLPTWELRSIDWPNEIDPMLVQHLQKTLVSNGYLSLGRLRLKLAVNDKWMLCERCGGIQHSQYLLRCLTCGEKQLDTMEPDDERLEARVGYFRRSAKLALESHEISTFNVEEHSAQLSFRDRQRQYATTEEHELRFLGVSVGVVKNDIDVLSCTTTMEVGIDIGSLSAVAMRNIPPRRDNYQQRAGRAGRRGSSLATVVAYGQDGPHDSYYFQHPEKMIRGELTPPRVQPENERLARRHFHAWAIQTFFHEMTVATSTHPKDLMASLGSVGEFFGGNGGFSYPKFTRWLTSIPADRVTSDLHWLQPSIQGSLDLVIGEFIEKLDALAAPYRSGTTDSQNESKLLEFLFDHGLLPTYAFPTDVVSLSVFDESKSDGSIMEQPQQDKLKALSEYAPGRTVVVNKKTYRIGGLYDPIRGPEGVAELLATAQNYHYCTHCSYVKLSTSGPEKACPVCGEELNSIPMIDPPGFSPEGGKAARQVDTRQDYTSARGAQLPTLPGEVTDDSWQTLSTTRLRYHYLRNAELLVANVGGGEGGGFIVCADCGAIKRSLPDDLNTGAHRAPFLGRIGAARSGSCNGQFSEPIALGTSFRSDVLLLRVRLASPFTTRVMNDGISSALFSLSEALALAASRVLDVESSEIEGGYRFLINESPANQRELEADLYLYDSASGGAGYSDTIGMDEDLLTEVLDSVRRILEDCPGNCDRCCNQCLRNYSNQFEDANLDRHLALALLKYAMHGTRPSVDDQRADSFRDLVYQYLRMEGRPLNKKIKVRSILFEDGSSSKGIPTISDYWTLRNLPRTVDELNH